VQLTGSWRGAAARAKQYGLVRSLYYLYWHVRLLIRRFTRGSYSQLGEDLILDELLGHRQHGFYVDIGAGHPRIGNNTKRFSKRGWTGINVEPDSKVFALLEADRKNDVNVNVGIGRDRTTMPFFRFDATNLSTFSRDEADRWLAMGFALKDQATVEVRTLSDILTEYCPGGSIDLMSMDTEGWEMEALEGNDWSRFKPEVLCIETGSKHAGARSPRGGPELHTYLEQLGYRKAFENEVNSVYFLSSSRPSRAAGGAVGTTEYSRHACSRPYLSLERMASYYYQMDLTLDALESVGGEALRILEVGGSNNILSSCLSSYFAANGQAHEIVSLDLDPSASPDIIGDVREIPLNDGSVDVAVCCEVLEHMPFEDVAIALRELRRVTNGFVILTIPHASLYLSLVARASRRQMRSLLLNVLEPSFIGFKRGRLGWSHYWEIGYRGYPVSRLQSLMSQEGLRIERDFRNPLFPTHHFFMLRV
jgi:FkbM family methyltransferase